jgi:type I restriction enzyme S subunit
MKPESSSYRFLAQICTRITDGTHQTPNYQDQGVIFISAKNIKDGHLDFSDRKYITGKEHEFLTKSAKPIPGDLLLTKSGSLGDVAVIPELDFEFSIFESLALLKPRRELVDSNYLYQYIRSPEAARHFHGITTGLAVKHLHLGDLRKLKVFLPPLKHQRKIAEQLSTWDTAIQKTEQLIAAKERLYSHELSRLISRGQHPHAHVGAFAEEVSARNRSGKWRTVTLSDIATVWKGQQLNKDAMVEDGAYYALNGGIKPSGRTTAWNCEADTITVSSGGNSCGFIRFNSERFWCGGDCFALKNLSSEADVAFLFHYLKGQQHRMMALRTGSGIPHVYRADVEAFPIILPDLATQTAIARYLNALREEIDLLGQSMAALKTQKRGLMQKLLTGQWRLPIPETHEVLPNG